MKKLILSVLCAGLMAAGKASAGNTLSVADVTILQGGQATMEIACSFDTDFLGFQVDLELNEDGLVTPNMNAQGKPVAELGFTGTTHTLTNSQPEDAKYRYMCVSLDNDQLPTSGTLVRIVLNANASAEIGDVYQVKLSGIELTDANKQKHNFADVSFNITIGEPVDPRVVLDENATTAPASATGVDVRVRRTIATGEWNTICLPFAMDATQVKAAFGNNVKLGDFTGCVTETDAEDNVTGITVNFQEATAIAANHPYIIKVDTENDIEEFTVDGVDIVVEDEPSVDKDEQSYKVGKNTFYSYNRFVGTYIAGTVIPDLTLFLNGNKFWYSKGLTTIKAFRGYFDFYDVLSSVDNGGSARMRIAFNEEVTEVKDVKQVGAKDGRIYNMQGQLMKKPGKGLYIKDGKVMYNK